MDIATPPPVYFLNRNRGLEEVTGLATPPPTYQEVDTDLTTPPAVYCAAVANNGGDYQRRNDYQIEIDHGYAKFWIDGLQWVMAEERGEKTECSKKSSQLDTVV